MKRNKLERPVTFHFIPKRIFIITGYSFSLYIKGTSKRNNTRLWHEVYLIAKCIFILIAFFRNIIYASFVVCFFKSGRQHCAPYLCVRLSSEIEIDCLCNTKYALGKNVKLKVPSCNIKLNSQNTRVLTYERPIA